jgi:DNA polymerase-1
MSKGRIFIIDLMPFLYRGHFVFLRNPRLTSTGINTSALIGFVNGVLSILKSQKPTHVVLAMDSSVPTFRHEAYPPYKAQREKMPEDLAASIPMAFELAEALQIPVLRRDGFEADDLMGSLAVKAEKEGYEVFLATPDKDAAQLITEKIKLFRPGTSKAEPEIYDIEKMKEHWSLSSPSQMIDLLALAGDTSDNIPGVAGVGEKTATALLSTWGSLENIIAHASELKGKLAERMQAGIENARMSKFLATIKTDIPLEYDIETFRVSEPNKEKMRAVCGKYELASLAKFFYGDSLFSDADAPKTFSSLKDVPHSYEIVNDVESAKRLAEILESAPRFAFDTETTGVDARTCELVGMSFATEPGKAWYVPVPPYDGKSENLGELFALADSNKDDAHSRVSIFASAFADPSKVLIAHNGKFDIAVLERYGIKFGSTVRDTMLAHYVTDAAARHKMDFVAREYLQYEPIPIEALIGEKARGGEQQSMGDIPPEKILDYAAEDADVTLRLNDVLRQRAAETGTLAALETSEEPLVPVLIEMEREGVAIDVVALKTYGINLDSEIEELAKEIRQYGDEDLNIDSPKQLGEFLFGKLGIAGGKKTSRGQYSTDEKILSKIVDAHPVVKKILEYRACTKLKSTYVDKLPQCINPRTGRVHTTFAQALTETGRLSSSDPNLQNIPIRSKRGKFIRAAFIPRDENHVLVSADYSQIELRIMAAMSGDESMLAAFRNGADIHSETAARVYDVMPGLVTEEMRSNCKMVNFGIIYGISAFGLSQRLNISRREASNLIESYFKLYPKIKAFMESSIAKARDKGYAVTILGRRRTLRDINSQNATARQAAERDAINTPVQGSAADLIKIAMIRVSNALKREGLKAKMILQIHDELLFDTPIDEVERVSEIVKYEMENAMDLGVPLLVEVGSGKNWLEAH